MKKLVSFFTLLLFTSFLAAQPGGQRGPRGREARAERVERVKAARQAFIAEKMQLTEKEAEAFFPVFWQYEEKIRKELRDLDRRGVDVDNLTEAEAVAQLKKNQLHRQRMVVLKAEAETAFLEVLPARKLIRLPTIEKAFRQRLWDRAKGMKNRQNE